jgi:hypothetical protein
MSSSDSMSGRSLGMVMFMSEMLSPLTTGRFMRESRIFRGWIVTFALIGATTTRLACSGLAFLTLTISPRPVPALRRTRPSIRMICLPSSSEFGKKMHAVDFFPTISTISPALMLRRRATCIPAEHKPRPAEALLISATRRLISPGFSGIASSLMVSNPFVHVKSNNVRLKCYP